MAAEPHRPPRIDLPLWIKITGLITRGSSATTGEGKLVSRLPDDISKTLYRSEVETTKSRRSGDTSAESLRVVSDVKVNLI